MDTDAVFLHHTHSGPSTIPVPTPARQHDLMAYLERLQYFLATAPNRWPSPDKMSPAHHHPSLNRFLLPTGEYVTCVLWNNAYYVTGTDIVRALVFRFEAFGRPVRNMKKFEEGIFSDLRNLKPGHDACLEEPKVRTIPRQIQLSYTHSQSQFLDLLFKYQCIRTQKKQKVFYWYEKERYPHKTPPNQQLYRFSVPHDRLFIDALDRDLKREKYGHESTTHPVAEPALSFSHDPKRPLFEQFNIKSMVPSSRAASPTISLPELNYYHAQPTARPAPPSRADPMSPNTDHGHPTSAPQRSIFFHLLPFLEGAPTYKQRRKKTKARNGLGFEDDSERLYGRRSLDANLVGPVVGRRSFELGVGRRSYEASPHTRHTMDESTPFLIHPNQFGLIPPMRLSPEALASPAYVCQLFTCGQAFATAEQLDSHMRTHENSAERGNMDVDSQHRDTSEIPQFNLTTPDGEHNYDRDGYDYEEEKTYQNSASPGSTSAPTATPAPLWGEEVTPTLDSQASYMSVSPFAFNATPTTSVSGSSPAMSLAHIQTRIPAEQHPHGNGYALPHPLSAPSHKLTFDVPALPSSSSSDPRPCSADSRHPHARRPSTASAVPSATASSSSLGFGGSSHAWRYQPYPISRRVATPSGYSSPARSARDVSPSAIGLDMSSRGVEYFPPTTASSVDYNGSEYASQGTGPADYASSTSSTESFVQDSTTESSPSASFAHMLALQETSPSLSQSSMELGYPQEAVQQAESFGGAENFDTASQQGVPSYNASQQGGDGASHHGAEGATYVATPQPSYPTAYDAYLSPTESQTYLFASPHAHYYEQPVA